MEAEKTGKGFDVYLILVAMYEMVSVAVIELAQAQRLCCMDCSHVRCTNAAFSPFCPARETVLVTNVHNP